MDSKHTPRHGPEPSALDALTASSSPDTALARAVEALASLDPAEAPEAAERIADRLGASLEEASLLALPRESNIQEGPAMEETEEAGDAKT